MQFDIKKRPFHPKKQYEKEYLDIAYDFTKRIYKEFGGFLKAVVLFGAAARKKFKTEGDIDILVVISFMGTISTVGIFDVISIQLNPTNRATIPQLRPYLTDYFFQTIYMLS